MQWFQIWENNANHIITISLRPIKKSWRKWHYKEDWTYSCEACHLPTKYSQKSYQEKNKRNLLSFYEKQVCQTSLARSDQLWSKESSPVF
jgi:hypothetical protein